MRNDRAQWIVLGSIGLLCAVFSLAVWYPESRKLAAYHERIVEAQEELGPSFFEPAMMGKRVNEVESLKEDINSSARFVPQRPELASVLRSLTQAVETGGVTDQSIQTRESKQHKHYAELPISLEFEDTFSAAYGVLEQIESLPRLVRVEALNLRVIDRDGAQQAAPIMQASLRLSSFYTGGEEK
ncbi:MAG: type 4a pilus biogenesis protein PilO [Planctomycetota bacterium]